MTGELERNFIIMQTSSGMVVNIIGVWGREGGENDNHEGGGGGDSGEHHRSLGGVDMIIMKGGWT